MRRLTRCDLCDNQDFRFLFDGHDRMHRVSGTYSLYQCRRCGLIFINPQPDHTEISKHYPSSTYGAYQGGRPSRLRALLYRTFYGEKPNIALRLLFWPLRPLLRSTRIIPSGTILDVGCGAGSFLSVMKQFGMECYGVEPSDYNQDLGQQHGLKVTRGSVEDGQYADDCFDVITVNHVLEHVRTPAETLKELHRILKPKGTLIIGVPQSDCLVYRLFGPEWVQLDVPRHLFTFSTSIVTEYARKAGFTIESIRYNSTPLQFLGSILYRANRYRKRQRYLSEKNVFVYRSLFVLLLPMAYLCNVLRIGDQIEVVLRKG